MQSWQYEINDVLLINRNGEEVLAQVVDYEDTLDDTTALYVRLRVSDGLRWGQRKHPIHKEVIIRALPDWYNQQKEQRQTELKASASRIYANMTQNEKHRLHKFAVEHGIVERQDRRSPLDILIDRACEIE